MQLHWHRLLGGNQLALNRHLHLGIELGHFSEVLLPKGLFETLPNISLSLVDWGSLGQSGQAQRFEELHFYSSLRTEWPLHGPGLSFYTKMNMGTNIVNWYQASYAKWLTDIK